MREESNQHIDVKTGKKSITPLGVNCLFLTLVVSFFYNKATKIDFFKKRCKVGSFLFLLPIPCL